MARLFHRRTFRWPGDGEGFCFFWWLVAFLCFYGEFLFVVFFGWLLLFFVLLFSDSGCFWGIATDGAFGWFCWVFPYVLGY